MAKYDAKVGKLTLLDRRIEDGSWQTVTRDVTGGFTALFDFDNLAVGWFSFPKGAAPVMQLSPVGQDVGEQPGEEYKQGLRLLLHMPPALGGGVRELISTSLVMWSAIDALHDQYLQEATKHPDQLPLVELVEVREIKGQSGTNFAPLFRFKEWQPRPADLPLSVSLVGTRLASSFKGRPPGRNEMIDQIPF